MFFANKRDYSATEILCEYELKLHNLIHQNMVIAINE